MKTYYQLELLDLDYETKNSLVYMQRGNVFTAYNQLKQLLGSNEPSTPIGKTLPVSVETKNHRLTISAWQKTD